MDVKRTYQIQKYQLNEGVYVNDWVVSEYYFTIWINGTEVVTILCTPKSLEPLVIGYLLSERIISSKDDIESITIDEKLGTAQVTMKDKNACNPMSQTYSKKIITTAGGGLKGLDLRASGPVLKQGECSGNQIRISPNKIYDLTCQFSKRSYIFMDTGGVHSCALCDVNNLILFEEDIGRHNALDKVLGQAIMAHIDCEDKIIITSGRVSEGMVDKVTRTGISFLVSKSAPTDLAIDRARERNITLVGFARGQRMNVYSNGIQIRE